MLEKGLHAPHTSQILVQSQDAKAPDPAMPAQLRNAAANGSRKGKRNKDKRSEHWRQSQEAKSQRQWAKKVTKRHLQANSSSGMETQSASKLAHVRHDAQHQYDAEYMDAEAVSEEDDAGPEPQSCPMVASSAAGCICSMDSQHGVAAAAPQDSAGSHESQQTGAGCASALPPQPDNLQTAVPPRGLTGETSSRQSAQLAHCSLEQTRPALLQQQRQGKLSGASMAKQLAHVRALADALPADIPAPVKILAQQASKATEALIVQNEELKQAYLWASAERIKEKARADTLTSILERHFASTDAINDAFQPEISQL